jgi:hypothetical protein
MSKVNVPEILIGDGKLKEFLSKGIKRTLLLHIIL